MLGLVEPAQGDERVRHTEQPGQRAERVAPELGDRDRSVGGYPGGVGLVEARERGRGGLVGVGQEPGYALPIGGSGGA